MIRIIIEKVLIFLLPTLIYVGYVLLRKRNEPNVTATSVLDEAPLLWLFVIGFMMIIASIAIFGSFDSAPPGQTYTPPGFDSQSGPTGQFD